MHATLAKPPPAGKPPAATIAQAPGAAELLAWYDRHARVLPWRLGPRARAFGERPDPYRIWLSEIMLQQTTVRAVAPYFHRFVGRWGNVTELAAAEDDEVMSAWAGLGYYSRARNLIACARTVAGEHGGRFPESAAELAKLPGIGAYTAAAIAAIAFGRCEAVVDGNVERVLARLFAIPEPLPAAKAQIRDRLGPLVPADRPGEFAEALMDLGATICTPKRPACACCPWSHACIAHRAGREAEFPVKAAKKERPTRYGRSFVARREDGAILIRRRAPRGLLGGMCEVPGSDWCHHGPPAAEPPVPADWAEAAWPVEHVFTHFRLVLAVHRGEAGTEAAAPPDHWWSPPDRLSGEALPSLMKKVIEAAYPGATKPCAPAAHGSPVTSARTKPS